MNTNTNRNWIEEVKAARKEESFEKAMTVLNRELEQNPNDPQIYYQMAWTHDALGKERDAVPAYEKAIELGLAGEDRKSALLGMGSTFRTLGEYEKSKAIFEKAIRENPEYRPYQVFYSLTLYNLKQPEKAMEILLNQLVETTNDSELRDYARALKFYSDKLDEIFE